MLVKFCTTRIPHRNAIAFLCGRSIEPSSRRDWLRSSLIDAASSTSALVRSASADSAWPRQCTCLSPGLSMVFSVALSATVTGRSRAYLPAMMAALGAGATVGYILPMSRAQESEADRIGLILMAMAGYDPREAVTVWERMRAANTGPHKAEWLSTHPADTTRIADIRHWLPEAMKYYRPQ